MNEKLQELGWEGKSSDEVSTPTEDGGEFMVKEMNGKQWLETLGDLGTNVWENATMPKSYWNKDEGYSDANIHVPPTLAGVGDGVIDQVTQYPQLIKLGYDVATKEQVRTGIWTAVTNLTPSSAISMVKEAVKGKIEDYNFSDKPWKGYHTVGKDGVTVVTSIMGFGFVKAGDKALENATKTTGEKIKEAIQKKLDDIEKEFLSDTFKDLLTNKFKNYKGLLSFDDWTQRYKTLYKNRKIGKLTEDEFEILEGGLKPKKGITTSDGKRYFDNVLEGTAREVKSGPITLSGSKQQILKDIEILNNDLTNGQIKMVEWHCFGGVDKQEIEIFIENNLNAELKNKNVFKIINY